MLVKFETKSNRVKGLCFHPKRPWILASLHNGVIQLWDYRMGTLIEQFDEHEGPVRSVDFHRTQPLFVSGGDDYKIKVWNYKLRRCIFTLQGHSDYIRSVEFHLEQPWIVSASDDQHIMIWNWQSRQRIAVLTGHNHYVMCASFHPTEDLVVSSSLDLTIRVWDISGLRKNKGAQDEINQKLSQLNQDLFGTNDAVVKYILEGHERGVNWAVFHPNQQLIVSGADDKLVKLWRIGDSRAWEVETLTGHGNNVSCVRFHAKKDLVIANSEDKTIRVWKLGTGQFVTSYYKENERFWILAVHPTQNLIAAGHDTGMMIFKLERERPPYVAVKNILYYIRDKYLRKYDMSNNSDMPVASLRRSNSSPIYHMAYNVQENCILITSNTGENATWELFKIPKSSSNDVEVGSQVAKGKGLAAVFTGINKYAYLAPEKNKLHVRNVNADNFNTIDLPFHVDSLFHAGSGRVLLKTEDKVHLYDFEQRTIIAHTAANHVRYVVWSEDMSRVALLCKHVIVIANSKLETMCSIHETIRIKSGAFDEQGVFIYSTLNHMKYCLPNGDSGTIKTLDLPIYIAKVKKSAVHYIDREGVVNVINIDATEYKFKMALYKGKSHEIKSIIGQSKILGDSIIAYLQQKGHPDIAMKFVQDERTKFDLALECGKIDIALQAANNLADKECWKRLGEEALRQGNYGIVQKAYKQTKDFERISFLYLITGNTKNLQDMLKIAGLRQDIMSRYQNALYLGDVEQRINILLDAGHASLAYVTAQTHGLTAIAEEIKKTRLPPEFNPKLPEKTVLLQPPVPILKESVWPLLHIDEEYEGYTEEQNNDGAGESSWESGIEIPTEGTADEHQEHEITREIEENGNAEEEGGGWEEIEDVPKDIAVAPVDSDGAVFSAPTQGKSLSELWVENSLHPADHIAAGSFNTAMHLLNQTFGIANFDPLRDYFMSIYMGSSTSIPVMNLPSISIALQRQTAKGDDDENRSATLPMLCTYGLQELQGRCKAGEDAMKDAKFEEAQKIFKSVIHSLLFVLINSKKEEREAKELVRQCAEYVLATKLELTRKTLKDNPQRSAELAAYFTRCKLNPVHIKLSVQAAMSVSFKIDNFLTAADFARRLLKMNPNQKMLGQAKYVVQKAEQKPQNKYELNYDDRNPFVICGTNLTPIYAGSESLKCSYCQSSFLPIHKGQLCSICGVGEIGAVGKIGFHPFRQRSGPSFE